jgi:hypothetical protein
MNYIPAIGIGDLLSRPKFLGVVAVEHFGVAVAPNTVLHNTPEKGEHLSTVEEFSAGQPITVRHTGVDPSTVMARSRQILANPKKYHAVARNCQHTVSEILKGIATSPVVVTLFIVAMVGVLLFFLLRQR